MAIIDGKALSQEMREQLKKEASALKDNGITPGLAVVLIGEDPASKSYVTAKERACESIGILSKDIRLPEDTSQDELLSLVEQLNRDEEIHGILIQLPLPSHISEQEVIMAIDPRKDVDGFHPVNVGKMMLGEECFLPCTPHGILKMLEKAQVETSGKEVVVIGRSNIVGKPIANMLLQKNPQGNATVTLCHTRTKDIKSHTLRADIIVAAVGRPHTLTADMVKDGTVVIDVGVNRVEDSSRERGYRLVGDADFDELKDRCSHITPVPGGVGPMTITMLLFNTIRSAEKFLESK